MKNERDKKESEPPTLIQNKDFSVNLSPLDFEEALEGLLETRPAKNESFVTNKKKRESAKKPTAPK